MQSEIRATRFTLLGATTSQAANRHGPAAAKVGGAASHSHGDEQNGVRSFASAWFSAHVHSLYVCCMHAHIVGTAMQPFRNVLIDTPR